MGGAQPACRSASAMPVKGACGFFDVAAECLERRDIEHTCFIEQAVVLCGCYGLEYRGAMRGRFGDQFNLYSSDGEPGYANVIAPPVRAARTAQLQKRLAEPVRAAGISTVAWSKIAITASRCSGTTFIFPISPYMFRGSSRSQLCGTRARLSCGIFTEVAW